MTKGLNILPILLLLLFVSGFVQSVSGTSSAGAGECAMAGQAGQSQSDGGKDANAAQPQLSDEELEALEEQMEGYMIELGRIAANVEGANKAKVDNLSAMLLGLTTRYDAFMQLEQANMVGNDLLMQLMAQYKVDLQAVTDSLEGQKKRISAHADMSRCEKLFAKYVATYDTLLTNATEYSLIQQTASKLEKVKALEQQLFKDVDQQYKVAQSAAALSPDLGKRLKRLESQYTDIQEMSAKIQAAEFKPFLARIQDYLKNCAYFAIIMMFFIMIQSKISAIKAAKKQAKKMKEMLKNNNDYPTI